MHRLISHIVTYNVSITEVGTFKYEAVHSLIIETICETEAQTEAAKVTLNGLHRSIGNKSSSESIRVDVAHIVLPESQK